ncbi:MAG: hypothetical protein AAGJ96_00530 [Pseudomonadota bacterium]
MAKIVYSHRIVSVMQQLVVDLGLTITLTDQNSEIDLVSNEAAFQEAAALLGLSFSKVSQGGGVAFTISR